MSAHEIVIGLAGLGTVGSGLVRLLHDNATEIERRTGKRIRLKWVTVRDINIKRDIPKGTKLTQDPFVIAQDPEVEVVIELIGGITVAETLIRTSLENGKSVVTANKALLAEKGEALFSLADQKNVSLAYEASVAGAIPIVQTIKDSLAGNHINSITGVLNGTSNYILSEMTTKKTAFADALKNAQELGFAEADPTLDIDGQDAAHKLKLLIRLAWGVHYPYENLSIQGIRNMDPLDIQFAHELGYAIKLLGEASDTDGKIEAAVCPFLVPHEAMLARVDGAFNAVHVNGNALGSLFLHGLGAGSLPTASAVLGDLMSLMKNTYDNTGYVGSLPLAIMLEPEYIISPWYLRVMVHDQAGVLRDLAGAFAKQNVSLAQVVQKIERKNGVPIVFMTHNTNAKAIENTMKELDATGILREKTIAYRILKG